uniref:hypothetical protein n=1 Tax=Salmonella sp. SAL4438 TaxID=3159893 RepID=UPI003977FCA0
PWLSNEEAKVIFIFEIKDPSDMMEAFAERMVSGLFARRKLTLLSDWTDASRLAAKLGSKASQPVRAVAPAAGRGAIR